mgnify:CR=1 FL=1
MTTHTFNPRPNPRPCAVLAMTVLLAASAQAQRIDVQPVVWEGWGPGVETGKRSSFSWQGKPLAFVPHQDFKQETAGFATGADVRIRWPQGKGRAANPGRVTAARIAVQDIAAPVLVAGAMTTRCGIPAAWRGPLPMRAPRPAAAPRFWCTRRPATTWAAPAGP